MTLNSTSANSPTPAQARRERASHARRKAILDAARAVFFARGPDKATVEDVAAQAEIAKGTVYLYFSSKEAITAALLLEGIELLGAALETAYDGDAPHAAEARLRRLAQAYLDFTRQNPQYFHLITSVDRGQFQESISDELYEEIFERSLAGLRWIVQAIRQGVRDGDFRKVNPRRQAGMVWAALNGVLVLFGHPLRRAMLKTELEPMYAGVLDMILRDLRAT